MSIEEQACKIVDGIFTSGDKSVEYIYQKISEGYNTLYSTANQRPDTTDVRIQLGDKQALLALYLERHEKNREKQNFIWLEWLLVADKVLLDNTFKTWMRDSFTKESIFELVSYICQKNFDQSKVYNLLSTYIDDEQMMNFMVTSLIFFLRLNVERAITSGSIFFDCKAELSSDKLLSYIAAKEGDYELLRSVNSALVSAGMKPIEIGSVQTSSFEPVLKSSSRWLKLPFPYYEQLSSSYGRDVFLVWDKTIGVLRILKRIQNLINPESQTVDRAHNNNPAMCVAAIDSKTENQCTYIFLELLKPATAISLEEYITRESPVYVDKDNAFSPIREITLVRAVVEQLTRFAEDMITLRMMHNDLKPSNIFITKIPNQDSKVSNYTLKIIDWGIAQPSIKEGIAGFSLGYSAPEKRDIETFSPIVLRSKEAAFQSEVYSIGAILIKLLSPSQKISQKEGKIHIDVVLFKRECGHLGLTDSQIDALLRVIQITQLDDYNQRYSNADALLLAFNNAFDET